MLHTDKTAIAFKAICNPGANILKDNDIGKEKTIDNKKTTVKQANKTKKSKEHEEIKISIKENRNSKDSSTKKTNDNEEVAFLDKKDEIEVKDEINNARKKRRRSSASIE